MEQVRSEPVASQPPVLSDRARNAIKIALSLTLALIVPMAMGWSQPSTAAITVMIIAAAGDTRQSLMAGSLRLAGTLAGAIIGLTLVALFAQDRLLYLASASLVVSLCLYCYSAFKGDGTVFMLTAVVTLLVFNGGNADDAFLYGVNRAYMTAFGVAVYTLVCSFLWPDQSDHDLAADARQLTQLDRDLFQLVVKEAGNEAGSKKLAAIAEAEQALAESWAAAKRQMNPIASYPRQWHALLAAHSELAAELSAAIEPEHRQPQDYRNYLGNYDELLSAIEQRFVNIEQAWAGNPPAKAGPPPSAVWLQDSLRDLSHLQRARVVARADALEKVLALLAQIQAQTCYLSFGGEPPPLASQPRKSHFHWGDPECIKLGLRVLITFWLASAVWIILQPPGGFLFVTLATLLLPMVSFTPLPPKMLYILFSLGFMFALPCYVLLLPNLTEAWQLALFLFTYAFIGHYVFQGAVSIFFLLGLFTLGIDNTMHYNVGVLLNIMLTFYLVITLLVFACYFIFPSKAEYLFSALRRRFFNQAHALVELTGQPHSRRRQKHIERLMDGLQQSLPKLQLWSSQIDQDYFNATSGESLQTFAASCAVLEARLLALLNAGDPARRARLASYLTREGDVSRLSQALALLGGQGLNQALLQQYDALAPSPRSVENELSDALASLDSHGLELADVAYLYAQLNRLTLLWLSLGQCREAMAEVDWQQLEHSRF